MPRRRRRAENEPIEEPEPTVRPSDRDGWELVEEEDEKLVPTSNVGGASPTPLGLDSGGNQPGPEDDLANLPEPEPPEPPEVGAVHVRQGESLGGARPRHRRR